MSSRTGLFAIFAIFFAAAAAIAVPRGVYRIALRNGTTLLAKDRPYSVGSVLLFHGYPSGVLTGVPREEVVGMGSGGAEDQTAVVGSRTPMLQPGEVIVLGPTGKGAGSAPEANPASPAPVTARGGVYDPRNPAYGYSPPRTGTAAQDANSFTAFTPVAPGDVGRAVSAEPPNLEPSVAPNGFPATPGAPVPLIGSDGRPILAPAGSPGSTPQVIGPNGTPVMAPSGAPGSTPPAMGPNGTPVLAPPGAPGSTPPAVGPNGYSASSPPGR
jgi:hypothetical protein